MPCHGCALQRRCCTAALSDLLWLGLCCSWATSRMCSFLGGNDRLSGSGCNAKTAMQLPELPVMALHAGTDFWANTTVVSAPIPQELLPSSNPAMQV